MSTECIPLLETPEDRVDSHEQRCSQLVDDLSQKLIENCDLKKKQRKGKVMQVSQNIEQDEKKPRRKDTPAMHISPFVPGALADFSEQLIKRCDMKEKQQNCRKVGQALQNMDQDLMKPRRKDTPALNIPPLLKGGKLVRDERRTILEDDEKEEETMHN